MSYRRRWTVRGFKALAKEGEQPLMFGKVRLTPRELTTMQIVQIEMHKHKGYGITGNVIGSLGLDIMALKRRGLATWRKMELERERNTRHFLGLQLTPKGFEAFRRSTLTMGTKVFAVPRE